ncbi:MAG: hypothetical protein IPL47_13625 [Phyllobacteriaceae bacterium]|nr:hypothetical protein [Phyllobacteriaceae bacterium]
MSVVPKNVPWTRGGWQFGVEPATARPRAEESWRLDGFNEIYGLPLAWTDGDAPDALPQEGAIGAIDGWREAQRGSDAYLVAARGVWSGFPDPVSFSLWRMKADEIAWRFLGHFDEWPGNWTMEAAR